MLFSDVNRLLSDLGVANEGTKDNWHCNGRTKPAQQDIICWFTTSATDLTGSSASAVKINLRFW